MEQILHSQHARRKRNSPKVNLTISIVIHGLLFGVAAFWAAREGYAGKGLQALTTSLVPKEKKPEAAKKEDKTEEIKKAVEAAKEIQREAKAVTAAAPPTAAPPPPPAEIPDAAPPPVVLGGGMDFGGIVTTDPIEGYRSQIENTLRARWDRPTGLQDLDFVAEVEMGVDAAGKITGYEWKKGSGNDRWDASVKKALAGASAINRVPPKGFPEKFTVRFDVVSVQEVPVLSQNP